MEQIKRLLTSPYLKEMQAMLAEKQDVKKKRMLEIVRKQQQYIKYWK